MEQAEVEWCRKESGGSNWGRIRAPIEETCDLKDLLAALDADAVNMEEILAAMAPSIVFRFSQNSSRRIQGQERARWRHRQSEGCYEADLCCKKWP